MTVRDLAAAFVEGAAADPDGDRVGLELPAGVLASPLTRASERLAVGDEHPLARFTIICPTGALPPDAAPIALTLLP